MKEEGDGAGGGNFGKINGLGKEWVRWVVSVVNCEIVERMSLLSGISGRL